MSNDSAEISEALRARMRPPPLSNPALVARKFGDDSRQPVRFYLYKDVLEELTFGSEFEGKDICVALLLGGFGVEGDVGFVEVSGFAGRQWVASEDDMYAAAREELDTWIRESDGDQPVVGFFVSVPGSAGRVTEEMARVHFSLFNIPFQPIVAFDPTSRELSVASRAPRHRFFNAAFRALGTRTSLNVDASSDTNPSESRGDSEE